MSLNRERRKLYQKRTPLHITGEFRYRTEMPYEEEALTSRWFTYLGLRLNLLKEGIGENRFKEKESLFRQKIGEFLSGQRTAYYGIVDLQKELIKKALNYEKALIHQKERRMSAKLKELMKELSRIDRSYSFRLGRYISTEVRKNPVRPEDNGYILPLLDVDMEAVNRVIEDREKKAKNLLEVSASDTGWLEAYRDSNLDLYLRYYMADANRVLHYMSAGIRFDVPFPFDGERLRNISRLELLSLREEFLSAVHQSHSQILDYAVRMKQNYTNVLNNLQVIKREVLEIEREIFLWKLGIGKVSYEVIVRNLTDIFNRLELIANYKYLNMIYANKIIGLLGPEYVETAEELFHAGI